MRCLGPDHGQVPDPGREPAYRGQTPAKPGTSRRLAVLPESQQHAQRFACRFGRIPCVRIGSSFAERIAVRFAAPMPRIFVSAGSGARHRADPCKTRHIAAARRITGIPTTRSTFRVPVWANPLRTNRERLTPKGSPCASRPRCPGSWCRLDQGLIGQTPAKPGSSWRFAALPESQQHAQHFACRFGRIPLNSFGFHQTR
jgi:hypothetical protein